MQEQPLRSEVWVFQMPRCRDDIRKFVLRFPTIRRSKALLRSTFRGSLSLLPLQYEK
jgi:hypothetical protein